MVYGSWNSVYGLWFLVSGLWFLVSSLWYTFFGLWFMVFGAWFMEYGAWWFMIHSLGLYHLTGLGCGASTGAADHISRWANSTASGFSPTFPESRRMN